jgi:hypothetical protein
MGKGKNSFNNQPGGENFAEVSLDWNQNHRAELAMWNSSAGF